ncbi:MAG: hypothetical protein K6T86_12235 [Pirellulales bacterium]|nr:hypothetical protein [Pirellulales bacterium]
MQSGMRYCRWGWAFWLVMGAAAAAQDLPRVVFNNMYFPAGATPYSADTHAEADFLRAFGEMHYSLALAREVNQRAYEHFIRNQYLRVDTKYKLRLLHLYYRQILDPPGDVRENAYQESLQARQRQRYQAVVEGSITNDLNWMLREIFRHASEPSAMTAGSGRLTPQQLEHVWFTNQGGSRGGASLAMQAHTGELRSLRWPYLLAGEEFAAAKEEYEAQRDLVLVALREGRLEHADEEGLRNALAALINQFDARYHGEALTAEIGQDYVDAKAFLRERQREMRALLSNADRTALTGGYAFNGTTVGELVEHMYQHGLEFGPPERKDRGTYQYLYFELLKLYEAQLGSQPIPQPRMLSKPAPPE